MARLEITRHVAADPAGVALLLAEPASWPDPDDRDQHWVVAAPLRVGRRFAARLEIATMAGRLASGAVTVVPSSDAGSDITLVLSGATAATSVVECSALSFLGLLAERAQARSLAA